MQHIAEDSLEHYAMGALAEPGTGPLEEHLLICAACQSRLQATDDYVVAMRAAAKAPVKATKKTMPKTMPKTMAAQGTTVKKAAAAPTPAVKRASGR